MTSLDKNSIKPRSKLDKASETFMEIYFKQLTDVLSNGNNVTVFI